MKDYNRYDMIPIEIFGIAGFARPIEFNSEPVGNSVLNKDGQYVTPSKAVTTCHKCGGGFTFDIEFVGEPPYQSVSMDCPLCVPPSPKSPFMNPLTSQAINRESVDPLVNSNLLDGTLSKVNKRRKSKQEPQPAEESKVVGFEEQLITPEQPKDNIPALDESDDYIDKITEESHEADNVTQKTSNTVSEMDKPEPPKIKSSEKQTEKPANKSKEELQTTQTIDSEKTRNEPPVVIEKQTEPSNSVDAKIMPLSPDQI